MLVRDSRTSSAKGAFGRHDSSGMRLVTAASWWTVERAQVNRISRAARRAAYPEEPIACGDGGADRGREQRGHSLGLSLVQADCAPDKFRRASRHSY